jgi:hypothetical protein
MKVKNMFYDPVMTGKNRLEKNRHHGTMIMTREGYPVSNRLHTRTVGEMAAGRQSNQTSQSMQPIIQN